MFSISLEIFSEASISRFWVKGFVIVVRIVTRIRKCRLHEGIMLVCNMHFVKCVSAYCEGIKMWGHERACKRIQEPASPKKLRSHNPAKSILHINSKGYTTFLCWYQMSLIMLRNRHEYWKANQHSVDSPASQIVSITWGHINLQRESNRHWNCAPSFCNQTCSPMRRSPTLNEQSCKESSFVSACTPVRKFALWPCRFVYVHAQVLIAQANFMRVLVDPSQLLPEERANREAQIRHARVRARLAGLPCSVPADLDMEAPVVRLIQFVNCQFSSTHFLLVLHPLHYCTYVM